MNKLIEIAQITSTHRDSKVMFADPLQVKSSPHRHLFTAYGVWSGPDGVYVMDGEGNWHGPLQEKQGNAEFMISSLYQRLKVLPVNTSIVVANYDNEINAVIFE
jgi:hypothetical protein